MARLIYTTTAPPVNRRRGVVYAKQGNFMTVRAGGIPVQPLTFIQNTAQVTMSAAAAYWAANAMYIESYWAAIAPKGSSAYATFLAQAMLNLTWGLPIQPYPPIGITFGGTFDVSMGTYAGTDEGFIAIIAPTSVEDGAEVWFRIYWQTSSLQPITYSSQASSTPGLWSPFPYVPPSGYVFLGSVGPCPLGTLPVFSTGTALNAPLNQPPTVPVLDAPNYSFTGSVFDLSYYVTDQFGDLLTPVLGPQPAGTPPYLISGGWQPEPFVGLAAARASRVSGGFFPRGVPCPAPKGRRRVLGPA